MKKINFIKLQCVIFFTLQFFCINSQNNTSQGPFNQLIIRGVTLINGNGAPPLGPVDIVVKNNIITKIQTIGFPGIKTNRKGPKLEKDGFEIDCTGMYLLPGLIDMHGHIGGNSQGASPCLNKY